MGVIFGNDLGLPIDFKFRINPNDGRSAKETNIIAPSEYHDMMIMINIIFQNIAYRKTTTHANEGPDLSPKLQCKFSKSVTIF